LEGVRRARAAIRVVSKAAAGGIAAAAIERIAGGSMQLQMTKFVICGVIIHRLAPDANSR